MSKDKIQILVMPNTPQFDVSDFPQNCERSVKGTGALFFRQNTLMTLTAGEFEHVKKERPDMAKHLTVKTATKLSEEQLASRIEAPIKAKAKEEAEKKAKEEAEKKAKEEEAKGKPKITATSDGTATESQPKPQQSSRKNRGQRR